MRVWGKTLWYHDPMILWDFAAIMIWFYETWYCDSLRLCLKTILIICGHDLRFCLHLINACIFLLSCFFFAICFLKPIFVFFVLVVVETVFVNCPASSFSLLPFALLPSFFGRSLHISFHAFARGPQDQRARALHDHRTRTTGPEEQRTRGPQQDQRTTGPEDHRTRGPHDQRTRGPQDHRARGA